MVFVDYTYMIINTQFYTKNIVRACSMFYPYEGYRSMSPLDAARVNRTIFPYHSVHLYCITLTKGRNYIKHDINVKHGKQNRRRGRYMKNENIYIRAFIDAYTESGIPGTKFNTYHQFQAPGIRGVYENVSFLHVLHHLYLV